MWQGRNLTDISARYVPEMGKFQPKGMIERIDMKRVHTVKDRKKLKRLLQRSGCRIIIKTKIMQKYKVTPKRDVLKGRLKYVATTVIGKGNAITNMELAKELSVGTSLNITDVLAIIDQLPDAISKHLADGEKVHLKGLGFFQTAVTSDPMDTPEEVTPSKVKFSRITFKAEKVISNNVAKNMRAQRIE